MADEGRRTSAEMSDDELFDDGPDDDLESERVIDIGPKPEPEPEPEPKAKAGEQEPAPKEGEEDEDSEYGRKVQKRIGKLTYEKKTAETRAERVERENEDLRRRLGMTEGRALDSTISDLEGRATAIRAEIHQAIENGDTDKQLDLNDKLIDVRADLKQAQRIKGRMRPDADSGGERRPEPRGERPTPEQIETAIKSLAPQAQTWVRERNFFGWTEPQRAFTMGVDAEMTREGYDPGTPAYYAEMDKRIGKVFPDLYDDDDDSPEPLPKPAKRTDATPPVAAPSAAPANHTKGGKVTLGAHDFRNMRTFGLDPENPEHCKEYAKQVRQSERENSAS